MEKFLEEDSLFAEALEVVVAARKASPSLLVQRLRVGYARAIRLVDMLEEAGVIGPADGARPREVLVADPIGPEVEQARRAAQQQAQQRKQQWRSEQEVEARGVFGDYGHVIEKYVDRYCDLASRSMSMPDEWGDESTAALPQLKVDCLVRIARQVRRDVPSEQMERFIIQHVQPAPGGGESTLADSAPLWMQRLYNETLPLALARYRADVPAVVDLEFVNRMTGIEFEQYVAGILAKDGFVVSGTPKTGDQGADLIASRGSRVFVIQAKRYAMPVGNKAVQEVVAARQHYKGDIAVVVTNSTFTSSAIELAHSTNVILVDGTQLPRIVQILER